MSPPSWLVLVNYVGLTPSKSQVFSVTLKKYNLGMKEWIIMITQLYKNIKLNPRDTFKVEEPTTVLWPILNWGR